MNYRLPPGELSELRCRQRRRNLHAGRRRQAEARSRLVIRRSHRNWLIDAISDCTRWSQVWCWMTSPKPLALHVVEIVIDAQMFVIGEIVVEIEGIIRQQA